MHEITLTGLTPLQLQAITYAVANPEAVVQFQFVLMAQAPTPGEGGEQRLQPTPQEQEKYLEAERALNPAAAPDNVTPLHPATLGAPPSASDMFGRPAAPDITYTGKLAPYTDINYTPDTSGSPGDASLAGTDGYPPGDASLAAAIPPATDVDNRGVPWHPDVHAGNKSKKKNGSWKAKPGVDKAHVEQVESQLIAQNINPQTAPPQPEAPAVLDFTALMAKITGGIGARQFTPEQVSGLLSANGILSTGELANHHLKFELISAGLDALCNP